RANIRIDLVLVQQLVYYIFWNPFEFEVIGEPTWTIQHVRTEFPVTVTRNDELNLIQSTGAEQSQHLITVIRVRVYLSELVEIDDARTDMAGQVLDHRSWYLVGDRDHRYRELFHEFIAEV